MTFKERALASEPHIQSKKFKPVTFADKSSGPPQIRPKFKPAIFVDDSKARGHIPSLYTKLKLEKGGQGSQVSQRAAGATSEKPKRIFREVIEILDSP